LRTSWIGLNRHLLLHCLTNPLLDKAVLLSSPQPLWLFVSSEKQTAARDTDCEGLSDIQLEGAVASCHPHSNDSNEHPLCNMFLPSTSVSWNSLGCSNATIQHFLLR
jgi:hypothetical protein